jgi:branched-chain amino acid transport system substrate-binding protein
VSVVRSTASRRTLRRAGAAAVATACVLLAFGLQTNGSAAATKASASAAAAPSWAKLFAKYVGAKVVGPANSKLAPVTVGWVNAQGGIVQSPESTIAVNFAVSVINRYLGGVGGGHPLKLKECFVVQSEAQGQACAEAFDNNPAVKFVLEGVMPFGSTGFMQTNDGKLPVLGYNPVTASSATGKNTYEVTAGLFGTDPGEISYLTGTLHAKNVSLLYPQDDPAGVTAANLFQQIAKSAGLTITAVGFSSTASDLLTPMTAANAQTTDASVVFFVNPAVCQAGAHATQQLNVKHVVALALCLDPAVQAGLGDYPAWTYVNTGESANLPKADPYVAGWLKAIGATAKKTPAVLAPFPQLAFGTAMTAAKLINRIGAKKLSPATFKAAILKYHGPSMFGPPNLTWGSVQGLPALGTTAVRLYTYLGNGKWQDATGGKWVGG